MEGGVLSCCVVDNEDGDGVGGIELPPGFRFHPTDEEIIMHYLLKKAVDRRFTAMAIVDADLNKCEPWDLPKKAKMGENERFFFFQRDRKYPTGMRTNRATQSGYWKATGKDKEIFQKSRNCLVGMKKTLVFYKGRAPKGEKTNWVMHEYRLDGNFPNYNISRTAKEEFVVCRVFHKHTGVKRGPQVLELARMDSFINHLLDSPTLPPLVDYNDNHFSIDQGPSSKADLLTTEEDYHHQSTVHIINAQISQILHQDPKNFLSPLQNFSTNYPFPSDPLGRNPNFHPQMALSTPFFPLHPQTQQGQNSMKRSPKFPFKGGDQGSSEFIAPKAEYFSSNNSVVSQSLETTLSTENMANEITSLQTMGDVDDKAFRDKEIEGIGYSPDMSDLESLWSY